MELNLADNERMSSGHSHHSILSVMKGFIDAVNEMDETVLIPSRLMDMPAEPKAVALQHNITKNTGQDLAVIPANCTEDSVSLHACYSMLKAVKSELIRGPISEEDRLAAKQDSVKENVGAENDNNPSLEEATARAFREHLIGLFGVLQQLTNVSKKLTTKYQEELGDYQSCFKPKSSSFLM